MKTPMIVIAGPTASGKSDLAVALAKAINGAIISGDSMQVYQGMDIGTAKITESEKQGIDHYLIDVLPPDATYSVHTFQNMAKEAVKTIRMKGQVPILAGGTGFYIQALVNDINFTEHQDEDGYRCCLEKLARNLGPEALHEKLKEIDPESYETIHPNNVKRVMRAIEYYHQTGQPLSEHNTEQALSRSPYHLLFYVISPKREILYERINQRVDQMIENGLVEEVKALREKGYKASLGSMKGIGYAQILDALAGRITLEKAIEQIKRDTRHFAKRQITWFKRVPDARWLDPTAQENILSIILKDIEEAKLL